MTSLQHCAAILVAAGLSSRFGPEDKLLTEIDGAPLFAWSLNPLFKARVGEIVVVTGANDKAIRELCADHAVAFANNPDPTTGLGASIAVGAASISDKAEAVFVCLGDMPLIPEHILEDLADALFADEEVDAAAPVHKGQRGHPVLFHRRHLQALRVLSGDEGARRLVTAPSFHLHRIETDDEGVVWDIDRRADLLRRNLNHSHWDR